MTQKKLETGAFMQANSTTHPLDGRDDWECYDQHISERNRLIEGKRTAEDAFIKTVVQLASGIILIVPGFLTSSFNAPKHPSPVLIIGLIFIFLSLISGLGEQFLSSQAYGKQIEKTDQYYTRMTSDISPPALSNVVSAALITAFLTFLIGIALLSISLLIGPWS